MPGTQGPPDPAEMLFEPTGDLLKDYSAYCEIEDKREREDLLDGIQTEELREGAGAKLRTSVVLRNLEYCLNKRDILPLASAIPHCPNLTKISLTGCGVTEHAYKVIVDAVYKSASVTTFSVDFNPNNLFKDPAVPKKDKNEVLVFPHTYRGAHRQVEEVAVKDDKKGKDSKKAAPQAQAAAPQVDPATEKQPIALPPGWGAILYTGIQHLSLRGDGITDKEVESLSPLLDCASELLSISLWGNLIGDLGAACIANCLRGNRRLTSVNLGNNRIGDAGAKALAGAFLQTDMPNEEAHKLRLKYYTGFTELPPYPTFLDLHGIAPSSVILPTADDKKDKKKEAPKGKGKSEGPIERPKQEFDKDCIRLDEGRVRVPGNLFLWSLNIAHNSRITAEGVRAFTNVLSTREPQYEANKETLDVMAMAQGQNLPAPYVATTAFERLEIVYPAIADIPEVKELNQALADFTASRVASPSKADVPTK